MTSPPTIMRLITRMNLGGPALHVLVLSDGLDARGYRTVLVAGLCSENDGDIAAPLPPGRKVVTLHSLSRPVSPWRDLAALWSAYRLMRRERPTIVHTHTAKAGMVGRLAAWAAGVPIIVHTFHGNSLRGYFSPRANAAFCLAERLLARITSRICVVSNQQLDELAGRFRVAPRSAFEVMPLGIDLAAELQEPLPSPRGGVLSVGWLGRFVEVKGLPLLAGIMDEVFRRRLPIRFLIGGDGPERDLVRNAVTRYGPERVAWTGWQRDIGSFLAQCDVLVQTSRNEGTPVALIQGMAAGRPYVSTPAGGVVDLVAGNESVRHDGCRWFENGVLADPTPTAFACALERFATRPSLPAAMGAAARYFAARRFQAERLVGDMDRLYQKLLEERAVSCRSRASSRALRNLTGESECEF